MSLCLREQQCFSDGSYLFAVHLFWGVRQKSQTRSKQTNKKYLMVALTLVLYHGELWMKYRTAQRECCTESCITISRLRF